MEYHVSGLQKSQMAATMVHLIAHSSNKLCKPHEKHMEEEHSEDNRSGSCTVEAGFFQQEKV